MGRGTADTLSSTLWERMRAYVASRPFVQPEDAEDIVQEGWMRTLAKGRTLHEGYLWKAVKSTLADYHRKRGRREREAVQLLHHNGALEHILQAGRLADRERSILDLLAPWRLGKNHLPLREVAKKLRTRAGTLRQRYSRALRRIKVELIAKWYEEREFTQLNRYRLPCKLMASVADLTKRRGNGVDGFRRAFKFPHLSAAIQNSTWALASAGESLSVVSFLKKQLTNEDLFRGARTYVADALIGFREPALDHFVKRHYFPALRDMRSRVFDADRPVPVGMRSMFDVRNIRILGNQESVDVTRLRSDFLNGDVDLHRAAGFSLLRIAPGDKNVGGTVVDHLRHERDETNAYYVAKFVMRVGLRRLPDVYRNAATLLAVRSAAQRWPGNFYLKESAARISSRLS